MENFRQSSSGVTIAAGPLPSSSFRHHSRRGRGNSSSSSSSRRPPPVRGGDRSGSLLPVRSDSGTPRYVDGMWSPKLGGNGTRPVPSKVLLVHGLKRVAVNCDMVFNLFCLYGNVANVKVLKGGKVLVEMQDVEAAKRCVQNLHLIPLDDVTTIKVKYFKQSFLNEDRRLCRLSDGTPDRKNYQFSNLNRFSNSETYADQRHAPAAVLSKILHFHNVPLNVRTIRTIHKAMTDALGCTDAVQSIYILPKNLPDTGFVELKSIELAAKAILLLNHMPIESSISNCLFLIKLSFSKWSEVWPMKSISSSGLLFSAAPHIPWHITWLQHKYEHVESTSVNEFRVLQKVRMVSTDGNSPWTLWSLMDHAMEFIEPASEITDARSEEPIRHPCDEPGCNCSFFR